MARGSKKKYTSKQKRKAEHIEEGYEKRGVSKKTAEARAWATVNKSDKGGKKSGSGRGKTSSKASSRKGGRKKTRLPLMSILTGADCCRPVSFGTFL